MDFGALPPEINSARMYAGPGAAPLIAASVAWDELATELHAATSAYSSVIAGLTSGPWLGPAAVHAAGAFTPYATWTRVTAGQAEDAAAQARAAVAAYETAFASTVPPAVIAANRSLLTLLVATNFFGQNSPAIASTEAHYCEMWAQDAAAMYGYAATSSSASTLTPFESPPQVTDAAGLAAQSTAVSEATGEAATTQTTLASLVNSVPGALSSMTTPASLSGAGGPLAAAVGIPTSGLGSGFGSTGDMANLLNIAVMPVFALSSLLGIAQTMQGMAATAAQEAAVAAEAAGAAVAGAEEAIGGGVMGAMGSAATMGSLSVPGAWTSVIPAAHFAGAHGAVAGGGVSGAGNMPPSLLGGMPRGGAGTNSPGPRYGLVPTVMSQPPSAGYGAVL